MKRNLTTGSVGRAVLYFSLPYILSYFLQTLYGMADLFIIGQFCGVESTTAVSVGSQARPFEQAIDLLLQIRCDAKSRKDWPTCDMIRNRLSEIGFEVKDTKDGFEWKLK